MKKEMLLLTRIMGIAILFLTIYTVSANADYKYNYYDFYEMETMLQDLETLSASLSPDVFSLQIIGYSHLGNPIYAVKFSDNPDQEEDAEPDVVIDGGIHSNEWISSESVINFIQYLFDVYYDGGHADHSEVVSLVDNFEIWLIPMINPDGRIRDDLSGGDPESFWTDTTYHDDTEGWRMNLQTVSCPSRPSGTNQGIDLNRNWSRKFWEYSDCTGSTYNGGSALIAPEAKALKQFINNHMVSLLFHQHSAIGALFSNSGEVGLGAFLCDELDVIYEEGGLPDPLLDLIILHGPYDYDAAARSQLIKDQSDTSTGSFLASGYCNGSSQNGQYYNWLWYPIDCVLAPDVQSKRAIQCVFYEYPVSSNNYGHPSEGKIGQYDPEDASNFFHPSSGDINEWIIGRSVEMNKYFIKQSQYPFSPRYQADMSLKPEAPETDLAIVGAKISEVGTGLPGCFTFDSDGRDVINRGIKRITWNVQNNGTSVRTINSENTICNHTDDPACSSPTTAVLQRVDVPPETIETFTYDYDFQDLGACKDYSVTLSTGEDNEYKNDSKVFVFTVTSDGDTDCDGTADGADNCAETRNGPVAGICTSGDRGKECRSDEWCAPDYEGVCSMNQDDTYPPEGNSIGDACDCEADFTCDGDVDAEDVTSFLADFGRESSFKPCGVSPWGPCNGDFDCDVDVDADDVIKFLEDFGREPSYKPCPTCTQGAWCTY